MTSCAGKRGRKGLLPLPACAAAFTHLRRSQERAGDRAPIPPTRSGGGWLAAQAARRVGALSGNAPHPSAWLRQSATLPFAKGRDRRLTRCVHAVARSGGGWQKDTLRVSVFYSTLDAKRRALASAARRVGALSGNAPHPSAWLRQWATLPFEKGRDRRPTTCVHAVARSGGGWQKDTLRVSVFIPTLDAKRRALATAARRVGALSGNAPHPSAWLRQSATLPFEKGRDQRLTRCVNPVAPLRESRIASRRPRSG